MIENPKDLINTRNNIISAVFSDDMLENTVESIKNLKEHNISVENLCTKLIWPEADLEGKSADIQSTIKDTRKFINSIFNEYEIKSAELLIKKQEELSKETFNSEKERTDALVAKAKDESLSLIISLIIKSINWSNKNATVYADSKYKEYLDNLETMYFQVKADNKKLENENTDLKDEIEKLKNKKFLGLFKIK